MPLYRLNGKIVFFIHIPKTGGTSIEQALRGVGCAEALYFPKTHPACLVSWQHVHADIYREAIDSCFYDYAFTIVRNPYSRLASEYKMKAGDAGGRRTFDEWFSKLLRKFHESPYIRDNHIRPQCEFLSPGVEIFRFENGLLPPLQAACEALRIDPPEKVPHARRGPVGLIDCTAATIQAVGHLYREDLEVLGYRPDSYAKHFRERAVGDWS